MLTSRISYSALPHPEAEDIFHSALDALFTDDTVNSHGTPGGSITYRSPRFGDIRLRIPAHPDVDEGRRLFAHYLWNAAVVVAEGIEVGSSDGQARGDGERRRGGDDVVNVEEGFDAERVRWDKRYWDVRGKRVLELGAGTALPSLIAALSGAEQCTITDHPSSPALTTGAIQLNVKENLLDRNRSMSSMTIDLASNPVSNNASTGSDRVGSSNQNPQLPLHTSPSTSISVYGYTWGTSTFYLPDSYGKPAPPRSPDYPQIYDRLIISDCLWMSSQHENLVKTILTFLAPNQNGNVDRTGSTDVKRQNQSCAIVVAGFHTGRGIVRDFFRIATGRNGPDGEEDDFIDKENVDRNIQNRLAEDGEGGDGSVRGSLKAMEIFEVDVMGKHRPWQPRRESESREEAKRWCVCAILVRR